MSSIPTTFVSRTWQPPPAPLCTYFNHTCVRFHSPATLSNHPSRLPFQPHLRPKDGRHHQHHFAPISTIPVCAFIPLQPSPIIYHVSQSTPASKRWPSPPAPPDPATAAPNCGVASWCTFPLLGYKPRAPTPPCLTPPGQVKHVRCVCVCVCVFVCVCMCVCVFVCVFVFVCV